MFGLRDRNLAVSEILDGNVDALNRWQPPCSTMAMADAQRMIVDTIERMERVTLGHRVHADIVLNAALHRAGADRPVRILEVATGNGWLIGHVAERAERLGVEVELTGSDINPELVASMRQRFAEHGVTAKCLTADAAALTDMDDGDYHVAVMSMSLHHLPTSVVVSALRELDRVSDGGMIVMDVRRNLIGLGGLPPLAFLVAPARGRAFAVHDTVTSVRRAYTVGELRGLLDQAKLSHRYRVGSLPGWNPQRLVAVVIRPRMRR